MSKSSTITDNEELLPLIHPGKILMEEFLRPLELSQNRAARELSVPPRRINEIVHGTRSITADTALRLARYFETTPQFWLALQSEYDLRQMERERGAQIASEVRPRTERRRSTG